MEVYHHWRALIYARPIDPTQDSPTPRSYPTVGGLRHHWATNGGGQSYAIDGLTMRLVWYLHPNRRVLRHLLADSPKECGEFRINSKCIAHGPSHQLA